MVGRSRPRALDLDSLGARLTHSVGGDVMQGVYYRTVDDDGHKFRWEIKERGEKIGWAGLAGDV